MANQQQQQDELQNEPIPTTTDTQATPATATPSSSTTTTTTPTSTAALSPPPTTATSSSSSTTTTIATAAPTSSGSPELETTPPSKQTSSPTPTPSAPISESKTKVGQRAETPPLTPSPSTTSTLSEQASAIILTTLSSSISVSDSLLLTTSTLTTCNKHQIFVPFVIKWLKVCRKLFDDIQVFSAKSPDTTMSSIDKEDKDILDMTCRLLSYLGNILEALKFLLPESLGKDLDIQDSHDPQQARNQPGWIDDGPLIDVGEEPDDDSLIDDSDDESLNNKLCTFTLTQKEFVNQHWYYCYTCNLIDRVGVCSVCVRVCHKDHDTSYAKYGSFFCDCAGREDSNCMALVKRAPISSNDRTNFDASNQNKGVNLEDVRDGKITALSKLVSSDLEMTEFKRMSPIQQRLVKQLEPIKDELLTLLLKSNVCETLYQILDYMIPAYTKIVQNESILGKSKQATVALDELQTTDATKANKRRKILAKTSKKTETNGPKPNFPVDFFESLLTLNDIDFGGLDVLTIYNSQQLKNRLNNHGLNITVLKTSGFSLDVINNDTNMVMCGVRVQMGCQDLMRAPTSIEFFGRHINVAPTTGRWYDLPMTRDEAIQAERKLTIMFGPSLDRNGLTSIDSIKVYGKSKELFMWPEVGEEYHATPIVLSEDLLKSQEFGKRFQNLLVCSVENLDTCLRLGQCNNLDRGHQETLAKSLSTSLLAVPYSPEIVKIIKNLLLTIYSTKQNYNHHRDLAALDYTAKGFESLSQEVVNGDIFSRMVIIMRSLCHSKKENLVKLSDSLAKSTILKNPELSLSLDTECSRIAHLITHLQKLFDQLYFQQSLTSPSPVNHIDLEDTLRPFIELVYVAVVHDQSVLPVATTTFSKLLICEDLNIALCARNSLIRLLKQKRSQQEEVRIHQAAVKLLELLVERLPESREVGGFRSISMLHVILVLALDLDCDSEEDNAMLKNLLHALREELLWNSADPESMTKRTANNEFKLVILRMFSILMSKVRTSTVASTVSSSTRAEMDSYWSSFCSSVTALSLIESDVMNFCFNVLKQLKEFWRATAEAHSNQVNSPSLAVETISSLNRKIQPKHATQYQLVDSSPFFQGQILKGNLFEEYPNSLTEMVLRIPYQIKKVSSSSSNDLKPVIFSNQWTSLLCEFLMISLPSNIKKHVRKLLTFICGSKDKYRQIRDFHFLESHMNSVRLICEDGENLNEYDGCDPGELKSTLTYETMTSLVEHLKACIEIAQNRCLNWQVYCIIKDQTLLPFLMKTSLKLGDDVSSIILELLQHALGSPAQVSTSREIVNLIEATFISTAETDNPDTSNDQTLRDTSDSFNGNLSQQLINSISKDLLSRFILSFLLETNVSSLRWQAHGLLCSLWTSFAPDQQVDFLRVLWSLWHNLPKFGRKAAQFVDLVGFITLKSPQCDQEYDRMFCQETLNVLKQQNQLLTHHSNAHIYSSIQGLVDLDAFYLESEPCSVCNSPEVAYSNLKLSSIRVDSRFTTTTQIIKLVGTHVIQRFLLRILDIKRSKMVKTISIFYNNKPVQSVVELKNKVGIWNFARKFVLSPGQTDVKIEFTLPIVACNLMIEFLDFYDNFQATSQTLQCPRCSTSVSANPGVCSNCGENVFQCHKCRSINYDERDPFLCTSCGFCKYARFDISLMAKQTCVMDPIENEEDRKRTVTSIGNLLEKADRVYRSLTKNKPVLELLLLRIHEQVLPDQHIEVILSPDEDLVSSSLANANSSVHSQAMQTGLSYAAPAIATTTSSSVNKIIQLVAQKYCVECRGLFEELSKITHKVLASRKELVEYDNRQLRRCLNVGSSVLTSANRRKSRVYSSLTSGSGRCYGCATATVEHCITMLKALATNDKLRSQICEGGVIYELVTFNLKNGSRPVSREVKHLLSSLTRDDTPSTTLLTDLLMNKIAAISKQDYQPYEVCHIVRHELALLSVTLESDDSCWELRLRCLMKIFAFTFELKNPAVIECLLIPCLKLLLTIIRPPSPTTRRNKDKSVDNVASVRSDKFRSRILLQEWLNDSSFVFEDWRQRASRPSSLTHTPAGKLKIINSILRQSSKTQLRSNYLVEKFGHRWRLKCSKYNKDCKPIALLPNDWLKLILFNQSSKTIRMMARSLVESLFTVESRRKDIIDLLTLYLDEIGPAGECAQEFYLLYKNIILIDHWRYYLALQGILLKIGGLVFYEIDNIQELEETTLNSSMSSGCSLKMLVELLTSFVALPNIRSHYKSKLVGFVLKGYLSLRKLIVQRTKQIDETQEMLLELLEGMTTGSETETENFINVCVDAIRNCHEGDIRTPVFIFERICSTIHPEENVLNEFFVSLEKDPQQEDYLQGRMLGNPYSLNESGIGPLMKDIKNKICRDCELLALLEDDSSMDLLVSNKIISLDLPVIDVYKKIWLPENHDTDTMRIIYRMRGLLGDATEEFIESFDSAKGEAIDDEQEYRMSNLMASSGGLEVMLYRLEQIDDLSPPFKPLLDVILRLFTLCTKTKNNRLKLLQSDLKTIPTLLNTLKLALNEEEFLDLVQLPKDSLGAPDIIAQAHSSGPNSNKYAPSSTPNLKSNVVDQILAILESILGEASRQPTCLYEGTYSHSFGTITDVEFLLNTSLALSSRLPHVSHKIIQVVPYSTLGNQDKMSVLLNYFKPSLDFDNFDRQHSTLAEVTLDLFCIMLDAIEHNDNGNHFKDLIISENIVTNTIGYLTSHAPPLKSSLLVTSEEWKDFSSKPALKYVLRILAGLSQEHVTTQILISRECIPIVHGLEQVSSHTRVGTLAENLLEAIKQHPAVAEKVELVRRQTKEEKKRLAMAVRARQLCALGMKANERGQVTVKSKLLEQCQDLTEDTGLICNICREGYRFQPKKVLGIYTYTKRCILEEFESKSRKSYGYTTVTHFNIVHIECHMSAVRSARGRDEWDSAALQNANTRCNGLLPIWGPQVPEAAYANALARHNSYLQDSTGFRDIGYHSTVHDIRLQLLRFSQERSFSEDSGGGGPQSNLHLLPCMIQTALYVLNSTKTASREYKRTLNYLEMSSNEIIENCYDVDSPYYWTALAMMVLPPSCWKKKRVQFLQRLLICNHVRRVSIKLPAPMSDTRTRAYAYYKSALIYFAIIDSFYNIVFRDASLEERWNQDWSATLAEYLKHNHQAVDDNIEILLNLYQNSFVTCTSIERFFEVIRLDEVSHPNEFLANSLESV